MDYCNKQPGASYAISTLNVTSLPLDIRFGLCLPEECRMADYNIAGAAITDTINPIVQSVLKSMCQGCFPPGESFQFFYRNGEYTENWQKSVETGSSVFLAIALTAMAIMIIGSLLAHYVLKRRAQRQILEGNDVRAQQQSRFMNSTQQVMDQSTAVSAIHQSKINTASQIQPTQSVISPVHVPN